MWSAELKKIRALCEEKNSTFWQKEIADCNSNTQRLWQTLHGVLGDPVSDDSCDHTADDFATFFTDKVDSVRASTMSTPPYDVPYRSTATLDKWTPVTTDEVEKLIGSSSCKTCQFNPVPTWLVKDMKAVSIHYAAVQQVTGCWVSSVRLQASRSSSTAEEGRTGHQPDEELQTCIESVLPL